YRGPRSCRPGAHCRLPAATRRRAPPWPARRPLTCHRGCRVEPQRSSRRKLSCDALRLAVASPANRQRRPPFPRGNEIFPTRAERLQTEPKSLADVLLIRLPTIAVDADAHAQAGRTDTDAGSRLIVIAVAALLDISLARLIGV